MNEFFIGYLVGMIIRMLIVHVVRRNDKDKI
jgi:hypothetical protein